MSLSTLRQIFKQQSQEVVIVSIVDIEYKVLSTILQMDKT